MIKLKKLLEETEPIDSTQWDDWYEYLEYFEYDIEKGEILKLINKFKLQGKKYFNGEIIKMWDGRKSAYLEYDAANGTASLIKDINEWVYKDHDNEFIDSNKIYNAYTECTMDDLQKHPGKVYHYTTEENWKEIQLSGGMKGSGGTGINNRYSHGIFTSINPEEYADGTYGDICLELNLEQFKSDSGLEQLNLNFEPEVEEYLTRDYIMSTLGIENRDNVPSDISCSTIIVGHSIPLKYIRQI